MAVVLWMGVIFWASSDRASRQHSSRLIEPFVRWLFPDISKEALGAVVLGVRKASHMTEYALLAILLRSALATAENSTQRVCWRRPCVWALAGAVLYAISDEIHQSFVPTRQGSVWDVLIDAVGAALGLLAVWCLMAWRGRARPNARA
jgi:VanZ family protein